MLKISTVLLVLLLITLPLTGCSQSGDAIILATTTSTENSGLLDFLLSIFTEDTGIEVKVIAVGTGQALRLGEDGEADVVLVHAKESEENFVAAGHGTERFDVMYNDFVLIGPSNDPLNLQVLSNNDIVLALTIISESNSIDFISRGDNSGTHKKELELWDLADITPQGNWYKSVGSGMGETILMAEELHGYTLTDRATYLSMQANLTLDILVEGDSRLFNQYGVIPVNPSKNSQINNDGANQLVNWLLSEKGQNLIEEFGLVEFGSSLFVPNAK